MAIVVVKEEVLTQWLVPLISCEASDESINWSDNTWIVEHLRHLANKIEEEQPKIYNIGLKVNSDYKTPTLISENINK